ncbi:Glycine--tRNA ligase [Parelaphostrongylus tenuis]|uniref:Glycine--tRNA ligase n=1 Tax=Parelaphostrongylus tenuis TaxID=148309 RepID=A0AAD5QD29_PARTN|nr:Glycine--tRNA ligase [Parelaphostrongylus tenuis]
MGCALKANMLHEWRKHFVLEEGMLEVDCTSLTPEPVLKASGHVDRFADWMVKDMKTGECFRADHLIKNAAEKVISDKKADEAIKSELRDVLARLEGFDDKDMLEVITKYNFKSPTTGNDLTPPIAFNLMFPSQNWANWGFQSLSSSRNSTRNFCELQASSGVQSGLIRVREFTMCEIEHFVDPNDKRHPKFKKVSSYVMVLLSACNQMDGHSAQSMTIGEAVEKVGAIFSKVMLFVSNFISQYLSIVFSRLAEFLRAPRPVIVANETLGYYMARTHMYLVKVGVDPRRLRFRQHLNNEMAHYAQDCWDAEILTSYGWIECVGNADRSCYDLKQHSKATNTKLVAEKKLSEPRMVNVVEALPNMTILGKEFKKDAKKVQGALAQMSEDEVENLEKQMASAGSYKLNVDGEEFSLTSEMVNVRRSTKTMHVEEITPSVIEPSFGIGRVMYAILEHSFRQREGDEQRTFLALRPLVAPIKCSVLPISANERLNPIIEAVREELSRYDLSYRVDDSAGSIGRRYARTDEIGIPFGVTVDFESEKQPWTVTLRHAESMEQIRLDLTELGGVVSALVSERMDWTTAQQKYPKFEAKSD